MSDFKTHEIIRLVSKLQTHGLNVEVKLLHFTLLYSLID